MRIMGSGTIDGGKLEENLVVFGAAHITDDLECNGLKIAGALTGNSSLVVHGQVKISGSFQIGGSLQGDNDMKVSGHASVGDTIQVKGLLKISGSLRSENDIFAIEGVRSVGELRINGSLSSEKEVILEGASRIMGNIQAEDILIGSTWLSLSKRLFGKTSIHYRIEGNLNAKNRVELFRTRVNGNIIGRYIKLNKGSNVKGTIYYLEDIEVHPNAKVVTPPIQIKEEDLEQLIKTNKGD